MSKTESNFTSTTSTIIRFPNLISVEQSTFHHDKGTALYYLGRNQDALRCFDKVLQQNPSDLGAHTYKVNILLRMNRYTEAIDSCNTILKMEPHFIPALYNKACALAASGSKEEANTCYKEASESSSYDATTCFYKGKALLYLDRKSEAAVILGKAIEKNKDYVDAYVHQGNALYSSGNYNGAINFFKKATEIENNYSDAYYGWGKALFALGENRGALEMFEKSIELNSDSPHAYNSAGVTAVAMDDKLGAIAFFSKAIKLNPVYPLYYCNKGKVLDDMGEGEKALDCFNKAEELSHSVKLGCGLSPGNIKYINRVLSEDRTILIERLKNLQEVTLKTQKIIDEMMQDSTGFEHIVETFVTLKRSASDATSEAINGLNTGRGGVSKQKSSVVLKEQLDIQHKEMESLLEQVSQLRQQQSTYGHKLSEHEDILEASGARMRAEVKEGFESLRETRPELYAYCKTFYWTAVNLFGAYRNLSTDTIHGNLRTEGSLKEEIFIAGAKKLASYGATITQGIPLLGGVLGAMDSLIDILYNAVREHKLSNKVNSINKVIQSKFGTEEDISLGVAKVALAMTCVKEQEILDHSGSVNQSDNKVKRVTIWLQEKLEGIKQSILPSIELHDKNSPGVTLALVDVAIMFVYICKNPIAIVRNSRAIEDQLMSIVRYGELDHLMVNIADTIFVNTNPLDSIESLTPPSSPSDHYENESRDEHKPTQVAGEESHCCCSVS